MKKLLFAVLLLLSPLVFSAISDVSITGFIVKYDENTVQLQQRGKYTITVPRGSIPKHVQLKTGREVTAVISGEEFMKRLKQKKIVAKKKTQKVNSKPKKKAEVKK